MVVNNNLQIETFLKSVLFAGVDLGELTSAKPEAFHKLLTHVLKLHQVGVLVPVSPLLTYSMSELQSAMRLLQAGKHMGKVIITARGGDIVQVSVPSLPLLQRLTHCR